MEKYTYKESGIEWLGKVPSNWKVDRLKDKTLAVIGGDWGDDPESDKEGLDIPVLRVADLNDIYFSFENLTIRKIKEGSFSNRKITERSLIIEKSGGGEKQLVGRVGYPRKIAFDAICSNFMANIVLDKNVDINFVNYLFSALYSLKLNYPHVQQTTGIQNLNVTSYLTTKVAFPPVSEQKAIADYLDKATDRIDRIIAIKEEQLKCAEKTYFSQLEEATTIGINGEKKVKTNIPYIVQVADNWVIDRIKDVAEFNPIKSKARVEINEEVEVVPMEYVSDYGQISSGSIKQFKEIESGLNYFENGDVIFAKITPCMENGKGAFVENISTRVAFGSSEFFVLRPSFRILGKYLYYFTRSNLFRKYLEANMKGAAGQQRVPSKFFQYCEISFPESVQEQREIIQYLDQVYLKHIVLKKNIEDQINTLKNYKKSLIHEYVTGKKQVAEIAKQKLNYAE